jgi:hypothetical protein
MYLAELIFPSTSGIFQDDNPPVHQSVQTKLWKDNNDVDCLDWPSQSPDLNIFENIWRLIKIRLQRKPRAPPLRLPYNPKHCVFHLSSDFRHTHTREFFHNTTCISSDDVDCLDWPSQSPDLNIFENIWRLIKIRLQRKQHTIHSKGDLKSAPSQEFGIPFQVCTFQTYSNILRSGDWDGQSRQSTSLLSFHNFVCTD